MLHGLKLLWKLKYLLKTRNKTRNNFFFVGRWCSKLVSYVIIVLNIRSFIHMLIWALMSHSVIKEALKTGVETIVEDPGVSPADFGVNLSLFAAQTASSRYPRSMSKPCWPATRLTTWQRDRQTIFKHHWNISIQACMICHSKIAQVCCGCGGLWEWNLTPDLQTLIRSAHTHNTTTPWGLFPSETQTCRKQSLISAS